MPYLQGLKLYKRSALDAATDSQLIVPADYDGMHIVVLSEFSGECLGGAWFLRNNKTRHRYVSRFSGFGCGAGDVEGVGILPAPMTHTPYPAYL